MYERIENCPTCNSKQFKNYLICDDHTVSKESFAITQCTNCDLLLTNPRPSKDKIGKYYASKDYISHTDKANNITNYLYKIVRNITFRTKRNWIQKQEGKKRILDYGCGTGQFLKYLKQHNWETTGIEPDSNARKIATQSPEVNVYSKIEELTKQKFDVITLWHVLEHVHDINKLLKSINKLLTQKGKLVIAVPNHESYDRKYYKEYWAAYDVPKHLYHFNTDTLTELMKQNSFKLLDIKPMKFDSFYVSLLSEKNRSGKTNLIKSFLIGLLSNRSAKKNNNNYSSLTYTFKKV